MFPFDFSLFLLTYYNRLYFFFFLNDTAPTEIYTLPLHDALPICPRSATHRAHSQGLGGGGRAARCRRTRISRRRARSAGGKRPAVSLGPPATQEKEEARQIGRAHV